MSSQHSDFPGKHCLLGDEVHYYLDYPVLAVFATVGKPLPTSAGKMANHWRLFFVVGHNLSIVFDMVKTDPQNLQGVLGILVKPYTVTNTAIKLVELELGSSPFTARLLWEKLNKDGFLDYSYSKTGEGCRAWITNTVNVMQGNHYVARNTVPNVLWPVISRIWSDADHGIHQEMEYGGFGTYAARYGS